MKQEGNNRMSIKRCKKVRKRLTINPLQNVKTVKDMTKNLDR